MYNVGCKGARNSQCKYSYVGETGRKLKHRMAEHRNALNRTSFSSNIAEHSFKTKHDANFEDPKVIYHEKNKKARKWLESWSILKLQKQGVPLMNDQLTTNNNIPKSYYSLL